MIFIERDVPVTTDELKQKLAILKEAIQKDDDAVRAALHQVVPTYRSPEEVNAEAEKASEMEAAR